MIGRLGLFALFSLSMAASTINLNTGVAAWQGQGPNVAGTVPVSNLGESPNPYWMSAPVGSSWVSTHPTDGGLSAPHGVPGTYTFTLDLLTNGLGGSLNYLSLIHI